MKLIALCTIFAAAGRVAPGGLFSVETEDEGRNLITRNFAREPKADELAALGDDDAVAVAAAEAAAADAKAKAEAEAAATAPADPEPEPEQAEAPQPEPVKAPAAARKR